MRKLTGYFILITIIVIAVYDIYVVLKHGNQESVSAHLLSLGEVSLFFPMLLGFTFGHLTWPSKTSFLYKKKVRVYSYIFFLVNGVPAVYDFYNLYFGSGEPLLSFRIMPVYPFLFSYVLGHYLWPMEPIKWSGRFKR